ncbi:MAG: hypothetical protein K1X87_01855 [Dehalococcoidia bacterium]|nr:hypothetical protein [Dehalococcoidia bacterium]
MATSNARSGVRLELLWALATIVSVLAVLTWRCALDPGATSSAGSAAAETPAATPFAPCGDEVNRPDEPLNLEGRACLLTAAPAGTRVEFNTTRFTVEGQPVFWRIRVVAWGDVEVTVDNRADEFSGAARRRVTTYHCTSLARSAADGQRIDVLGCTSGDVLTF